MTDTLDSGTLDSGCLDDGSDPAGADDPSADDACSANRPDDTCCEDDTGADTDAGTSSEAGSDACGDGADTCGTEGSDDGACDTDPACWDDTLSAVPGEAAGEVGEVGEVAPSTGPAPLVALPAAALASLPTAAPVSPFAGVPGLGGDTALGRVDVAERATGSTAGLVAQQEIVNSVREGELVRSTITESRREEAAAALAENVPSSTLGTF